MVRALVAWVMLSLTNPRCQKTNSYNYTDIHYLNFYNSV